MTRRGAHRGFAACAQVDLQGVADRAANLVGSVTARGRYHKPKERKLDQDYEAAFSLLYRLSKPLHPRFTREKSHEHVIHRPNAWQKRLPEASWASDGPSESAGHRRQRRRLAGEVPPYWPRRRGPAARREEGPL